jgi:hypothetical protein
MGAGQSIARVREQETKVRNLEAAVADLEIQREEHRKLALVAEAEKNNLARQNVLVRERAGRDRELRALATGQTDVDRAFMESEYAKSKATELRALADFTELKAKHEMLVQENQALQLRRQAEQDIAASKIRQAQELRLFTAITLMDNYTSTMNLLYDEILRVRKDALEFPSNSVSLCDKMNFKQVKINSANELMECQRLVDEEQMRDRRTLAVEQLDFLLSDTTSTSISKQLQSYIQGTEDAKDRLLASVAPPNAATATLSPEPALPSSEGVDVRLRLNRNYDDTCRSAGQCTTASLSALCFLCP